MEVVCGWLADRRMKSKSKVAIESRTGIESNNASALYNLAGHDATTRQLLALAFSSRYRHRHHEHQPSNEFVRCR
eukprot:scaffold1985_cov82-Skeletonema_marinoi.AAC.3